MRIRIDDDDDDDDDDAWLIVSGAVFEDWKDMLRRQTR